MYKKYLIIALAASTLNAHAKIVREVENKGCEAGYRAFQKTMLPFLKANCASCHGADKTGPEHASDDAKTSYETALTLADFQNIERSAFYEYVKEKHWLSHDSKQRGTSAEEMRIRLEDWFESGQRECVQDPADSDRIRTSPHPVTRPPASDDEGRRVLTLSWDLGLIRDDFKDASFELEIETFSDPKDGFRGAYRVRRPRLIPAKNQALYVRGIHVLVNGKRDPGETTYDNIEQTISLTGHEAPLLSGRPMILLQRSKEADEISIEFDELRPAKKVRCNSPKPFRETVLPTLQGKCLGCHAQEWPTSNENSRTPTFAATSVFSMQKPDNEICATVLQWVDRYRPQDSPLLFDILHSSVYGSGTLDHVHNKTSLDINDIRGLLRNLKDWLKNERE